MNMKETKSATRCRTRQEQRKCKQKEKNNKKRRRQRSMACAKAAQAQRTQSKKERKNKQVIRGGTWNTRGWGGRFARLDQAMKTECLLALASARKWCFCIFSDVRFSENGVREYNTKSGKWTVIIQGRVAIGLNAKWSKTWREGGAKVVHPGRTASTRCMAVEIAGEGWVRGWYLTAVYAPIGSRGPSKERDNM